MNFLYEKRVDGLVRPHDCCVNESCCPLDKVTNNSATASASSTHDEARLGFFPTATV